ncbi:hypothetical protein D9756_002839 [Leucocoprinus leucothites]|uniref:Ricin B lectin domain-containing protein n=1 Tax=Leucocoprinus leucothites TaxID=201217 RepID=A0A8H5GCB2_9AGAR|nr:hypothetical protein D9756_002839 [Leucoagaricus leucothites]
MMYSPLAIFSLFGFSTLVAAQTAGGITPGHYYIISSRNDTEYVRTLEEPQQPLTFASVMGPDDEFSPFATWDIQPSGDGFTIQNPQTELWTNKPQSLVYTTNSTSETDHTAWIIIPADGENQYKVCDLTPPLSLASCISNPRVFSPDRISRCHQPPSLFWTADIGNEVVWAQETDADDTQAQVWILRDATTDSA